MYKILLSSSCSQFIPFLLYFMSVVHSHCLVMSPKQLNATDQLIAYPNTQCQMIRRFNVDL